MDKEINLFNPLEVVFDDESIKENLKAEKESEYKTFEESAEIPQLYNPCSDMSDMSKQSIPLTCPSCFTLLTYDSQRNQKHSHQYRAITSINTRIEENKEDSKEYCSILFPVLCSVCMHKVGVYELDNKLYIFFDVLPGLSCGDDGIGADI